MMNPLPDCLPHVHHLSTMPAALSLSLWCVCVCVWPGLQDGEEFRRSLIRYETEMLKAFGFIMNVEHPHRLLINYCTIVFMPYTKKPDDDDTDNKCDFLNQFVQQAWDVANDR